MKRIDKVLKRKSLTFVSIIILVFNVLVSIGIYFYFYQGFLENKLVDQIYRQNQIITSNTKEFIDARFTSDMTLIFSIQAYVDSVDSFTQEEFTVYMSDVLQNNETLHSIEVLSLDAITEFAYPFDESLIGNDYSLYKDIELLDESHTFIWDEPSTVIGESSTQISVYFRADSKYIVARFDLSYFEDLHQDLFQLNQNKHMMILNKYGIIIFDSNSNNDIYQMRYNNFDDLKSKIDDEEVILLEVNDVKSVISIANLHHDDWYVSIYETQSSTYAFINELASSYWITVSIILVIFIFTTGHFVHVIMKKLKELQGNLKVITGGKIGHQIQDLGYSEFQSITDEFNRMSSVMKDSQESLKELAYYDKLTGLYSRNYLSEKVYEMMKSYPDTKLQFFYIDLTRFHIINESYGYDFGDRLLKSVAERLQSSLTPMGMLARIESDEFVIVCGSEHEPISSSLNIIKIFEDRFNIDNVEIIVTPSIGVSAIPDNGSTFEDGMMNSNIALLEAKKDTEKNYSIFNDEIKKKYSRQLEIEISIQNAFKNKEFVIDFQPILSIKTQEIVGFEALSRWNHPTLGLISPGEYIEKMEQLNKIHLLDRFVLKESIKMVNQISKRYQKQFVINVNISGQTILREDFEDTVISILKKHAFDPRFLELELTESIFINDYSKIKNIMSNLIELGIRFSEDDFGDGYSSLNYLAELDLNTVKISKTILRYIESNVNTRILVETIVNLSKQLGFETIVEGVETIEIFNIFKELDCDYVQGYYFYRPMNYKKLLFELDKIYK